MGIETLEQIPEDQLNAIQIRVRRAHLTNQTEFDRDLARPLLADLQPPTYFLDFETIMFAVPIWKQSRPFQNLPFQYSLHSIQRDGQLHHSTFLELDGDDPRERLVQQMIRECGNSGPVIVWNAAFERRIIEDLARDFPNFADPLRALADRLVDLLPVARKTYYNPIQNGSWSLKAVTPAIAPELSYSDLEGVQVGSDAGIAYLEAISPQTPPMRREQLRNQMLEYCKTDTLATVKIYQRFCEWCGLNP